MINVRSSKEKKKKRKSNILTTCNHHHHILHYIVLLTFAVYLPLSVVSLGGFLVQWILVKCMRIVTQQP